MLRAAIISLSLCFFQASADHLLLHNGKIHTMDPSIRSASALVVEDGIFVYVGDDSISTLTEKYELADVVDLKGLTIIPGMIDAHAHLVGLGFGSLNADLVGSTSVDEVVLRLEDYVANRPIGEGEWLRGRGWDQNRFEDTQGAFPTKYDLDDAFPSTPLYLTRVDGHAAWVNSAALRAVPSLPDEVDGGEIVRDENGDPTGILIDNAMTLVSQYMPPYSDEELEFALEEGIRECNRLGLTSVHDCGADPSQVDLFAAAVDDGDMSLRLYVLIACPSGHFCPEEVDDYHRYGFGVRSGRDVRGRGRPARGDLTVNGVKLMADGALGSWGAAMLEPYSDNPDTSGIMMIEEDELISVAHQWAGHGYQIAIHAIGDRANKAVLDAFEEISGVYGADIRPRLEHAQILQLSDIERIAELKVIASMQPTHATSDMLYAEDRIGPDRIQGAYAWRKVLDQGGHLSLGSDFPVESADPLKGFYAAVTRMDELGQPEGGWYPEETLSREEALRGFTLDAAFASFDEDRIGSITPGKLADFVVLDRDILDSSAVPAEDILKTRVLATFVGGEAVYKESTWGTEF